MRMGFLTGPWAEPTSVMVVSRIVVGVPREAITA